MNPQKGILVVKLGGHSIGSTDDRARQARILAEAVQLGARLVVVHGGGAQITRALEAAGLEPRFVNGLRVTDEAALAVMEPVATTLGKEIAHALSCEGAPAVALTGRDANLLQGEVKDAVLGRVGTITGVNADLLRHLIFNGITPVVGPLACNEEGALNVNADEVASAIAKFLNAKRLVLLTDVDGVKDATGQFLPHLNVETTQALIASGIAAGGMIPKLQGALDVLDGGVGAVQILNGQRPGDLIKALSGETVGTTIAGGRKLLPSSLTSVLP